MENPSQKSMIENSNNEDTWHIYYLSKLILIKLMHNRMSENYIQFYEMLDIDSDNTDEVLNILRDYLNTKD